MRKPAAPNHEDEDMIYETINKSKNPERTVEFSKMKSLNPEIEFEDFEVMQNIQQVKQIEAEYQQENDQHLPSWSGRKETSGGCQMHCWIRHDSS